MVFALRSEFFVELPGEFFVPQLPQRPQTWVFLVLLHHGKVEAELGVVLDALRQAASDVANTQYHFSEEGVHDDLWLVRVIFENLVAGFKRPLQRRAYHMRDLHVPDLIMRALALRVPLFRNIAIKEAFSEFHIVIFGLALYQRIRAVGLQLRLIKQRLCVSDQNDLKPLFVRFAVLHLIGLGLGDGFAIVFRLSLEESF